MRSVTFDHGGRELALRMDMNALARYQDRAGETIGTAIKAISDDGWDIVRGRRLFWAALSVRITEDEAGDIMTDIGMGRAMELTGEAVGYAIKSLSGESEGAKSGNEPKAEKKAT